MIILFVIYIIIVIVIFLVGAPKDSDAGTPSSSSSTLFPDELLTEIIAFCDAVYFGSTIVRAYIDNDYVEVQFCDYDGRLDSDQMTNLRIGVRLDSMDFMGWAHSTNFNGDALAKFSEITTGIARNDAAQNFHQPWVYILRTLGVTTLRSNFTDDMRKRKYEELARLLEARSGGKYNTRSSWLSVEIIPTPQPAAKKAGTPAIPVKPSESTVPAKSAAPTIPAKPAAPAKPAVPAKPVTPTAPASSAAPATSGTCGSNLKWKMENGILTISGSGEMRDGYTDWIAPWYSCRDRIRSVVIQNGMTKIEQSAFDGCTALTSVSIPGSVKYIGNKAFNGCTALASLRLPDSVTGLGIGAFKDCTALNGIVLSSNLHSIADSTFENCVSLSYISIPEGVTAIGIWAFSGCSRLKSVMLPDTCTQINNRAFQKCTGLTEIYIPKTAHEIELHAFLHCSNLQEVYYGGTEKEWKDMFVEVGMAKVTCNISAISWVAAKVAPK